MESLSSCARCSGRRAEGGGWMGGWWGDGSGWGERRTAGEGHGQAVGPRHGVGGGQRAVEGAAGRDQAVAASTRRAWTCGRWVGRVRGGAGPSSPVRPPLSACGQAPLPSGSGHPLPKAGPPPGPWRSRPGPAQNPASERAICLPPEGESQLGSLCPLWPTSGVCPGPLCQQGRVSPGAGLLTLPPG